MSDVVENAEGQDDVDAKLTENTEAPAEVGKSGEELSVIQKSISEYRACISKREEEVVTAQGLIKRYQAKIDELEKSKG